MYVTPTPEKQKHNLGSSQSRPACLTKLLFLKLMMYSFNATLMLETLRGKRMMFVGDSLNRGQYVSFVCLLHSIIPEDAKSMETFDSLTVFTAKVTSNYCLTSTSLVSVQVLYFVVYDFWFLCRFPMSRSTMPRSSSIGLHFFSSRTRIMPWFTGYLTGLLGKVQSINMGDIGKVLIY